MGKTEKRMGWFVVGESDKEQCALMEQERNEAKQCSGMGQKNEAEQCAVRWQGGNETGQGVVMYQDEKDSERMKVLRRIRLLEQEGRFDVDAEDDPPTIPLMPDQIDYLRTKFMSRLKRKAAYMVAGLFVNSLIRKKKLVIKQVIGMENLNCVKSGAIITCNHFHPYDCLMVEHLFQNSEQMGKKQLFKVIREGNYTNFPGFYGVLFRNCNTLPLSRMKETMYEFLKAVDTILTRGDFILIYPEQSMWWNYRKPKPLKNGAFKFAVRNHVPIIPFFITMEDGDRMGADGFPVQEYTIFIKEPIYPQTEGAIREQAQAMKEENSHVWKQVYEDFYGCPLAYTVSQERKR